MKRFVLLILACAIGLLIEENLFAINIDVSGDLIPWNFERYSYRCNSDSCMFCCYANVNNGGNGSEGDKFMGYKIIEKYSKEVFYLVVLSLLVNGLWIYLSIKKIYIFIKKYFNKSGNKTGVDDNNNQSKGASSEKNKEEESDDFKKIEELLGNLGSGEVSGEMQTILDGLMELKRLQQKLLNDQTELQFQVERLTKEKDEINDSFNKRVQQEIESEKNKLNDEIKRINGELEKANAKVESKDKEIQVLKDKQSKDLEELAKQKEAALETQEKKLGALFREELVKEQTKMKEYREKVTFVLSPVKQCTDYALQVLEILNFMDTVEHRAYAMSKKGLGNDDVIYYFNKSLTKFNYSVKAAEWEIAAWRGELRDLSVTGLYKVDGTSKLRSVFNGLESSAEQLKNLKYRIHHDFMSEFCSASLILCQELSLLDQLSRSNVNREDSNFFKDSYETLQMMIKKLSYEIILVQLFTPYQGSSSIKAVSFSDVEGFESKTIVEIVHMGVNYSNSKEVTEVVIKN